MDSKQATKLLKKALEEKMKKDPLLLAWDKWIQEMVQNYAIWMTITFPRKTPQEYAEKAIKRFFHKLNNGEIKFYDKFLDLFLFYESNNHGTHIHGLVSKISLKRIPTLMNRLSKVRNNKGEKEFGKCYIKPIHKGVSWYLAKKQGSPELEHFMKYRINSHEKRASIKARPDLFTESFNCSLV